MRAKDHAIEPEELMAYLDGELATRRAAEVEAHMGQCVECQSVAKDFKALSQRMREWPIDAPDFPAPVLVPEPSVRPRKRLKQTFEVLCGAGAVFAIFLTFRATQYRHLPEMRAPVSREQNGLADRSQFAASDEGYPAARAMPSSRTAAEHAFAAAPQRQLNDVPSTPAPLVAHTAHISLVVKDFSSVEKAIDRIVLQHHGYMASLTVNSSAGAPHSLDASLRTLDADLGKAMSDIRALGRVESETRGGEEVTQQSIDLDARLANAHTTVQRLTELLKTRTGKLVDVLAVEEQIDATQGEIERMEAERKNLRNRVEYATLDVHVSEEYRAVLDPPATSWSTEVRNAAVQGFTSLKETAVGVLTFLLARGPSLLFWVVIVLLLFRVFRRRFEHFGLSWWKHDQ